MLSSLQLPAAPCPCRRPTSRARCVRVAAKKVSKATPVVAAPAVLPPVPPPPRSPPPPWAAPVAGALAAAALVYALSRSAAPKLSSAAAAPAPSSSPPPAPGPGPVLVTGAAGRTGRLVVEKLLAAGTPVRALVRTSESASLLPPDLPRGAVYVADCARDTHTLRTALHGCSALVVCTSATPKLKLSGGPPPPGAPPSFVYPEGGLPERVDWVGQRMQYAAARAEGVRRVVVVGSRGGTQPESALNSIGGSKTNILLWKRKAEQYLVNSGLSFTIVRAGGLLDAPGGARALVVGADDEELGARTVPRADVAEVVVRALASPAAEGRSLDLVSKEPGAPPAGGAGWDAFFAQAKKGM